MSDPIKNREQGSVIPSQASRITDSTQASDEKLYKTADKEQESNRAKVNEDCSKVEPGRRVRQ